MATCELCGSDDHTATFRRWLCPELYRDGEDSRIPQWTDDVGPDIDWHRIPPMREVETVEIEGDLL